MHQRDYILLAELVALVRLKVQNLELLLLVSEIAVNPPGESGHMLNNLIFFSLAVITDATGAEVAETGSFRGFEGGGQATGTFFHLIGAAQ